MSEWRKYATGALFSSALLDGAGDPPGLTFAAPTLVAGDLKRSTDLLALGNLTAEFVAFTSTGTNSVAPEVGDEINNNSETAIVIGYKLTSGTWGSDAAGYLFLEQVSGTLAAGQVSITGGDSDAFDLSADATPSIGGLAIGDEVWFALTSAEMTCRQGMVLIEDQGATVWAADGVAFQTYGHASAMRTLDFDDAGDAGLATVSDIHSRLVVMEAAADSDTASAATIISDTHSRLVVVEASIDSDQVSRTAAISDVKSELVVLSDAVSVLDAAVDSDQVSRTTAISDVKSRLVVVETAIDSDTASAAAIIASAASSIEVIEAKASDTHSRLVVVEAAIDSDQASRATAISDVKSELVVVSSAVATLDAAVDSDQTSRTSAISDVKSRLVVVEAAIDSDQTSRTTAISDVKSRLTLVHSETTQIQSDAALLEGAHSEPTGVPAANESVIDKIGYLYMALRNKVTVTATKKTFYGDDDAAEWEQDLQDDDTTYTQSEANDV